MKQYSHMLADSIYELCILPKIWEYFHKQRLIYAQLSDGREMVFGRYFTKERYISLMEI